MGFPINITHELVHAWQATQPKSRDTYYGAPNCRRGGCKDLGYKDVVVTMASRIRGQDSRALEQGYLPRSPYIAVDELAPYTDAMAIAFSVNMYAPNAWDGVSNPIFRDVANSMGFTPIYIPGGKG